METASTIRRRRGTAGGPDLCRGDRTSQQNSCDAGKRMAKSSPAHGNHAACAVVGDAAAVIGAGRHAVPWIQRRRGDTPGDARCTAAAASSSSQASWPLPSSSPSLPCTRARRSTRARPPPHRRRPAGRRCSRSKRLPGTCRRRSLVRWCVHTRDASSSSVDSPPATRRVARSTKSIQRLGRCSTRERWRRPSTTLRAPR
jgi:hypothetical protein